MFIFLLGQLVDNWWKCLSVEKGLINGWKTKWQDSLFRAKSFQQQKKRLKFFIRANSFTDLEQLVGSASTAEIIWTQILTMICRCTEKAVWAAVKVIEHLGTNLTLPMGL